MAITICSTDQVSARSGVKILGYSDAGVGKTKLCSTAWSPIILSAEAGLLSLRQFRLPYIEVKTVEDLIEVHQWLVSSAESRQFATVCLDSISEIGETVLSNAKRQVKDPRQAYGELIEKMIMVIKQFRDLPGKHVYMSAKMEPLKDAYTGSVRFYPSLPGSKLGPALPYYFDEVLRLGINKDLQGNEYRFLQTQPDLQYVAKDRSGSLAPIEPPDLNVIFRKILGV